MHTSTRRRASITLGAVTVAVSILTGGGPAAARDAAGTVDPGASFKGASADGTRVFFTTADRLVATDTDAEYDVYQRAGGTTRLISAGAVNGNGPLEARFERTSADGLRVFFETAEPLTAGDTDGSVDIYERSGGSTRLVSAGTVNGNGAFDADFAGVSTDGARVFFETAEPLVANDTDASIDVYERSAGTTKRVSRGSVNGNMTGWDADFRGASADGTRVFFRTREMLVAEDVDYGYDVYERSGGTTKRISAGAINGNGAFHAGFRGASTDGTRVLFDTAERLVTGDTDSNLDIYERSAGATRLGSAGALNGNGTYDAYFERASADGTRVFFYTAEPLVAGDTDTSLDVYERSGATTRRVSVGTINGNGAFDAYFAAMSADGARVFLETNEPLVAGDTDNVSDIYERSAGVTRRISAGAINGNGAFGAELTGVSRDGSRVFFHTLERLVAADTDSSFDVYERSGGSTRLVSTGAINGNGAFGAAFGGISRDGARAFIETEERLVSGDTDTEVDVYERSGGTTKLVSKP